MRLVGTLALCPVLLSACVALEDAALERSECAVDSPLAFTMNHPNVMLVVDKSGSMQGARWAELEGLLPYLPDVGARAQVGLSLFPSDGDCRSGVIDVPIGPDTASEVGDALAFTSPEGGTPIAATLAQMASLSALQEDDRDNIVVLLSDGEETCGGDPIAAARRLTGLPEPIELYVIGFATDSSTNTVLAQIAEAAEPTTPGGNFYPVDTAEELIARLYAVTGSCTVEVLAAPDEVVVELAGVALERCTETRCEDGYRYEPSNGVLELQGASCLDFQMSECTDLLIDRR